MQTAHNWPREKLPNHLELGPYHWPAWYALLYPLVRVGEIEGALILLHQLEQIKLASGREGT